jgi:hypothetical protein
MTKEGRQLRRKRCLEIISDLEASLRNHESPEMLQRWERDELHAQWREDNDGLLLTPSEPTE